MTRPQPHVVLALKILALACLALWIAEAVALSRLPFQVFPGFRYEATMDVSAINDAAWNGPKAGLQQYDRILEVDGHEFRTPAEFHAYYSARPAGTLINYKMWRDGKTYEKHVATETLSLGAWLRSYMSLMVPALVYLIVGMVPFWLRPEHKAAGAHLLMTCSVVLFGVTNNDIDALHWFLPLFVLAYPLLGSAMLHLALVFPEPGALVQRKPLAEYWPYAVAAAMAAAWALFFRPESYLVDPRRYELHMLMYNAANAWVMVGFLGLLGAVAFKTWRSPGETQRRQARIALIGAACAFLPIVVFWGLPYFFLGGAQVGVLGEIVYYSYLAAIVFPVSIAYAILRAQLFDIRVVVKRTVTYAIVTGALVGVYFLLGAAVRGWADIIFGIKSGTGPLENLIATGAVAAAFSPLANWTRVRVDRLFDRGDYDVGAVLERYGKRSDEVMEPAAQFDAYMDVADQTVHPQHISIFVRDKSGLLTFRAARRIDIPPTYVAMPDQHELIELRKAEGTGLLAGRARTAPLVEGRQTWGFALYIPLVWNGEVIGRVNFGPKRSDQLYTERDRQLLGAMAHRLADKLRIADMLQVAVAKARLDGELATAQAIHAAMLPSRRPEVPGLDLASASKTAVEFGGDYYDLVPLDGGRLAIAIGDVAGKGVQAAMVMAMTKAAFSTLVKADPGIDKVMQGLNQMICDTIPDRTYRMTTFCYAIVDPARREMTYACAGHPPPLRFRSAGTCESLPAPGAFPFGSNRRSRYQAMTASFEPGDGLVFYTDGITEAAGPDGRAFYDYVPDATGAEVERDELAIVVGHHAALPADAVKDAVLRRLREFTGKAEVADDVTMVVVKALA
ncbi:MAG: SpoIIE family protein phosphatase [Candidatus Sericytochromatia bacterium]|nr:SpoIIE family protein phosphatase [Candidatus Tanganyikabacteria bacterium]